MESWKNNTYVNRNARRKDAEQTFSQSLLCVFLRVEMKGTDMNILRTIFRKREKWTKLETLYTSGQLEAVGMVLAENGIPYKARAALLPTPISVVAPLGTASRSLWYLSVHPEDVSRVYHCLDRESDRFI